MFLNKSQVIANEVVRKQGFEPVSTIPLTKNSRKHKTDVVSVIAIKEGERHSLKVSTQTRKILSNDIVVVQYDPRDPQGNRILWVKKFSRSTK